MRWKNGSVGLLLHLDFRLQNKVIGVGVAIYREKIWLRLFALKLNHHKNVMSAYVILPFQSSVSLKSLMDSATFLLSVNSSNVPFPRNGHHEIFSFTTNSNLSCTKLQNWKDLIRFIWMMTVDTSFHLYFSERHQNALAFHSVTKIRGWV